MSDFARCPNADSPNGRRCEDSAGHEGPHWYATTLVEWTNEDDFT